MEQDMTPQPMLAADMPISKQEFLQNIVEALASYNWPSGSIECINPNNAKLVYLWGHRFKGKAEGSWTAKVDGSPKITVNDKAVNLVDGTPYSGPLPDFTFDLIVIDDNQDTPYWAKDYCKLGWNAGQFQQIDDVTSVDVMGSKSGNPLASWLKNGNDIVDQSILPFATELSQTAAMAWVALDIVPPEVVQQSMAMFQGMKFASRDVTTSTRNNIDEEVSPVLIPFYLLEFNYEGKTHFIAQMGNGSMTGNLPAAEGSSESPDDIVAREMPDKIKQVQLVKWGWVLAVILLLAVNFAVAVIALIAWAVAYWFMKKPIDDRKKQIENEYASQIQMKAQQLKRQLLG